MSDPIPTSPPAPTPGLARRTLVLLFLAALVVRVVFVLLRGDLPAGHTIGTRPGVIGAEAGVVAEGILAGGSFASPFIDPEEMRPQNSPHPRDWHPGHGGPTTHLAPLYPIFLALGTVLTPFLDARDVVPHTLNLGSLCLAVGVSLLCSALLPVFTAKFALALRLPARVAVLAGLLMVICPESLRAAGLIWDEAPFVLAATALLLFIVRALPAATPRTAARLGVGLGLLSLLNPAATLALPAAYLVGLVTLRRPVKQIAAHAALIGGVTLLVGLPWHLRNLTLNPPQVVFVRGNFWLEVWSNLNPVTFTPAGPKVAHPWPVNGTERLEDGAGHPLTEAEYYAYCRRRALARLAEPGVAVSHVVTQANAFWLGLAEAWRWHRSAAVFFLAQGVPALVGLVGLFLARKTLAPHARAAVLVMLIVFPLPYYLTGGGARYRHPIDPILYIGIACAVGYAVALARRGARAGAHR